MAGPHATTACMQKRCRATPAVLAVVVCCSSAVWLAAALPPGVVPGSGHTVGYGELQEEWRGEVVHLSWAPRMFIAKSFLTDEECDHLIKLANPSASADGVAAGFSGEASTLNYDHDDIVSAIEKRVAQISMIPKAHQEPLRILHYETGQDFPAHFDTFSESELQRASPGGQRVVTVLMYLSTPGASGETVFPKSTNPKVTGSEWSKCARAGFSVKPYKGDALLFYSLKPDGELDDRSEHAGCAPSSGDKWVATKYLRVSAAIPKGQKPPAAPGACVDEHEQCIEWAYFDECTKNPSFMHKSCRKSCNKC